MGNLTNLVVFVAASIVVFCIITTCGCTGSDNGSYDDIKERNNAFSELMVFQGSVSTSLESLADIAENCSMNVAESGADDELTVEIFDRFLKENSAIYTIIYVDESGTVKLNNSGAGGNISGMNLISQGSVKEQTERKVPMLTDNFILHDGTSASALYYPVFDSEGFYRGFVSLSFIPYELVKNSGAEVMMNSELSAMITEPGGLVLYDSDPLEVGKETFDDSLYEDYPDILNFADSLAGEWSGVFEYSFYNTGFNMEVRKEALWTTVPMWDKEWRVFVIRELSGA